MARQSIERDPRIRDVYKTCGFRGCTKFAGHGGFHEIDARYDLPVSAAQRAVIDEQDERDALAGGGSRY